jgi:riboflavin biosynthesis pyrimidine reductase
VRILADEGPTSAECLREHVTLPASRPVDRAFVRLNMIASADGASAVAGLSGGLGNREDHAVFQALRANADGVLVGLTTAIAEHYQAPPEGLQLFVVAPRADVSGAPELLASGRATLILPEDAGPIPPGIPELRAGTGVVDLRVVVGALAGKVLVAEGGPTIAGILVSLGLVDEFFVTIAPRVVAGGSARVAHGPDADPATWALRHGFVDDEGFLFLRYALRAAD